MNKIATLGLVAFASLALAACNQTTVASNAGGSTQKTGYNSASMPPAAYRQPTQQASAMGRRYDAECRAKGPVESSAYSACLQNLPAGALVASNR
jgi:hypothetical protein